MAAAAVAAGGPPGPAYPSGAPPDSPFYPFAGAPEAPRPAALPQLPALHAVFDALPGVGPGLADDVASAAGSLGAAAAASEDAFPRLLPLAAGYPVSPLTALLGQIAAKTAAAMQLLPSGIAVDGTPPPPPPPYEGAAGAPGIAARPGTVAAAPQFEVLAASTEPGEGGGAGDGAGEGPPLAPGASQREGMSRPRSQRGRAAPASQVSSTPGRFSRQR